MQKIVVCAGLVSGFPFVLVGCILHSVVVHWNCKPGILQELIDAE
jgi:hypothetical protein